MWYEVRKQKLCQIYKFIDIAKDASCADGWECIPSGCYKFATTEQVPYANAGPHCEQAGGQLYVPNSDSERIYVAGASFTGSHPIWVGCTDEDVEGTYQCVDGSQLQLDVNSGKIIIMLPFV